MPSYNFYRGGKSVKLCKKLNCHAYEYQVYYIIKRSFDHFAGVFLSNKLRIKQNCDWFRFFRQRTPVWATLATESNQVNLDYYEFLFRTRLIPIFSIVVHDAIGTVLAFFLLQFGHSSSKIYKCSFRFRKENVKKSPRNTKKH